MVNTFNKRTINYSKLYFCIEFQLSIMNISRIINFICIVAGGAIAIYAQAEEKQNMYLLMGGLVLLMFGIYRISRNIPSKYDKNEEETFIKSEDED